MLFVAMHRPKRSPGQRFRFEQYIPYLEQHGYNCDISYIISASGDHVVYAPGNYIGKLAVFAKAVLIRIGDILAAHRYDVIFIYREALMINTGVVETLLAMTRARLVFDFDDAIWLQGVSKGNARLSWLRKGPSKFPGIIRRVDMVLAGNDYLADYARQYNGMVRVMPTTLDTDTHAPRPRPPHARICIGWSGSPSTAPHFDLLIRPLLRVKERFGARVYFRFLGDETYRRPELDIVGRPWREETEADDVAELDIGLMPLPDDAWSRGKCGFKALLYMALAIPPVASPVGVNKSIIENGVTGFLARDDDEWVSVVSSLVEDGALRMAIGREARGFVVNHYSLQSKSAYYLSLFDQLCGPEPGGDRSDHAKP